MCNSSVCIDLKKLKQNISKRLTQLEEPREGSSGKGMISSEACGSIGRLACPEQRGAPR